MLHCRFLPALLVLTGITLAGAEHGHEHAAAPRPAETSRKGESTGHQAGPTQVEAAPSTAVSGHAETTGVPPAEAQAALIAGNARFVAGKRTRSTATADDASERAALAGGQHPFAAILTCADSRLSPELIFDQSLGDLFVVRNAGNVAESVGEGSLEYAVEHLGVKLIVVMGHASCGAVKAVIGGTANLPGHLVDIQGNMPGLFAFAELQRQGGTTSSVVVQAAVERNADDQAGALIAESPVIRARVASRELAVVPAVYQLESGTVHFRVMLAQ